MVLYKPRKYHLYGIFINRITITKILFLKWCKLYLVQSSTVFITILFAHTKKMQKMISKECREETKANSWKDINEYITWNVLSSAQSYNNKRCKWSEVGIHCFAWYIWKSFGAHPNGSGYNKQLSKRFIF